MKQLHHTILAFLAATLLTACERELPYNVGNQETQLVMNALLDVNKEENLVHLCLSEPHSTRPVTQATVTLYINDRQDAYALAVEIASLTRRQQRGRGLRMA